MKLSQTEIKKRLIRLRNIEFLSEQQRFKIRDLRDENRALKQEIIALKTIVAQQQKTIESLQLRVEELQIMVFGRKKKDRDEKGKDDDIHPPKEGTPRTTQSYKRPLPAEHEVTETIHHPLNQCLCGTTIHQKQTIVFYEEDIPLPAQKIVRKHYVEKGVCPKCNRWDTSHPLPNHKTVIGKNTQKYICYLSVICRLSFSQIRHMLVDTYHFNISEGEIAKILHRESVMLRPLYEQLKTTIRGEPCIHLDETGWKLLRGGDTSYAWVMSGTESKESVFLIGESRGKGNVEKLLGSSGGFVVTDDYGAYKTIPKHQLCWAHLIRKWRDLAQSGELSEIQQKHCKTEYEELCAIYTDVEQNRSMERYDGFSEKLYQLSDMSPHDPQRMIRIKTTLRKNIPLYLTCLRDPVIPLTNNQAERSLRHLVLKRKVSFGSATKKTADTLAVLVSVLLSLKQRFQSNFFKEYLRV